MIAPAARDCAAKGILTPRILQLRIALRTRIAAPGKHGRPVQAFIRIAPGIQLNHSAHLPAILCWNARGVDAHRVQVIRFDLRSETRGAIIR